MYKSHYSAVICVFVLSGVCLGCTQDGSDNLRLTIVEPVTMDVYNPGDTVAVKIEPVDGYVPDLIHVSTPAGALTLYGPEYTGSFEIPAEAIGVLRIVVLGMSSSGSANVVSVFKQMEQIYV